MGKKKIEKPEAKKRGKPSTYTTYDRDEVARLVAGGAYVLEQYVDDTGEFLFVTDAPVSKGGKE